MDFLQSFVCLQVYSVSILYQKLEAKPLMSCKTCGNEQISELLWPSYYLNTYTQICVQTHI